MRTSVNLDVDVAAALKDLRKATGASFKELINGALRAGLRQIRARPKRRVAFRTKAVDLGRGRIGGIDCIAQALPVTEGESRR